MVTPFYIVDDGVGVAGDEDSCGNDMEGVPLHCCIPGPMAAPRITWDNSHGWRTRSSVTALSSSGSPVAVTINEAGTGYNGGNAGTLDGNVDLINQFNWWSRCCCRF